MDEAYRLISAFFSSPDDGLRLLISEPELMGAKTGLGETPLHYLAVENQLEAVRTLVEHGAEVDTINECGGTPLSETAALGHENLVRYLLSVGAGWKVTGESEPILNEAVQSGNIEVVRMLINAGADVNIANDIGETPLHIAAEKGANEELLRLLVESGADLNARRIFDETPLLVAQNAGATAIVEVLAKLGAR